MKPNFMQRIITTLFPKSEMKFVAGQLRKPSGSFAPTIANKMDISNEPLYHLTLESMSPQSGDEILEIGFGSGKFMHHMFAMSDGIKVSGLDYSPDMVRLASEYNRHFIETGQLSLHQGSSDKLPFPDHTFDKVFCNMVVFFWDRPEEHLKEIRRVLKRNGRFYTGIRTKESMMKFPFTRFGFHLYDPVEWKAIVDQNGFTVQGINQKMDQPFQLENGETIQLESVCVVAEKNAD